MDVSILSRCQSSPGYRACFGERSSSLSILVVPIYLLPPPPPPFLVQPYLSQYPQDQRESIFVVVPLAYSPLVPPGLGPVDLLTAVMAPFHVHPTPSYAMLVGHSRLSLNRHIAVVVRSATTPRHGRGHGPRLPWLLTTGPNTIV